MADQYNFTFAHVPELARFAGFANQLTMMCIGNLPWRKFGYACRVWHLFLAKNWSNKREIRRRRSMSKTVTFTLDGAEVSAPAGQTIWDVTKGQGFIIPHLCHRDEPGYRSDGNCRACMVEVEGERTLVASCIRPVAEGMVVHTRSDRAKQARRMVMEMLVADQPKPEVAHDKSSHLW